MQHQKNWCGLTITDAAARQIKHLVEVDKDIIGIRLSIKKSGCAGFTYIMDKVNKLDDGDLVYEHDSIKLFVPIKIMPFIDGTELDYVQEGLNYVFKFNNPKAQHTCGCGNSFGL